MKMIAKQQFNEIQSLKAAQIEDEAFIRDMNAQLLEMELELAAMNASAE